jgi:uncharacterized protein (TIGR04255 family)
MMGWEPINDKHSVERVAFSVQFRRPPSPKRFAAIQAKVRQIATQHGINELSILPQSILQIPVPDHAGVSRFHHPLPNIVPAGWAYRRTSEGKVLEEIVLHNNAVAFSATIYSRWEAFLERVEVCLGDALNSIAGDTYISEMRVECWDLFNHCKSAGDSRITMEGLINPHSQLIPAYYKTHSGAWHVHMGFFADASEEKRSLVNAKVDVVENSAGVSKNFPKDMAFQAHIYTLVSSQFLKDNDGYNDWDGMKSDANQHHSRSKMVVADVIDPKLSENISLNADRFCL